MLISIAGLQYQSISTCLPVWFLTILLQSLCFLIWLLKMQLIQLPATMSHLPMFFTHRFGICFISDRLHNPAFSIILTLNCYQSEREHHAIDILPQELHMDGTTAAVLACSARHGDVLHLTCLPSCACCHPCQLSQLVTLSVELVSWHWHRHTSVTIISPLLHVISHLVQHCSCPSSNLCIEQVLAFTLQVLVAWHVLQFMAWLLQLLVVCTPFRRLSNQD